MIDIGLYIGERLTVDGYEHSDAYVEHGRFGSRLCVRISTNLEESQELLNEYATYRQIRKHHQTKIVALPRVLGIFADATGSASGHTNLALITEYVRPLEAHISLDEQQK